MITTVWSRRNGGVNCVSQLDVVDCTVQVCSSCVAEELRTIKTIKTIKTINHPKCAMGTNCKFLGGFEGREGGGEGAVGYHRYDGYEVCCCGCTKKTCCQLPSLPYRPFRFLTGEPAY